MGYKIYRIVSRTSNPPLAYIGVTTSTLKRRFNEHRADHRRTLRACPSCRHLVSRYASFEIFEADAHPIIELIELVEDTNPCSAVEAETRAMKDHLLLGYHVVNIRSFISPLNGSQKKATVAKRREGLLRSGRDKEAVHHSQEQDRDEASPRVSRA